MTPVNFKESNHEIGKNREDVQPLPVRAENGVVTSCWKLEPDEIEHIKKHGTLAIVLCSYGRHAQPAIMHSLKPQFPITVATKFTMDVKSMSPQTSAYYFGLTEKGKKDILGAGELWISVLTYGGPMQPIHGDAKGPVKLPAPKPIFKLNGGTYEA